MKFEGRFLWVVDDAQSLKDQLGGELLKPGEVDEESLSFGVNTDAMISGAACTLGYSPQILGPYFLAGFKEAIEVGDVVQGQFDVIIGGDAYGSGSSREAAVVAHQGAGIKLVVAKSFQRIFQENLVYVGLPFTTDFSILEEIKSGRDIDIALLNQSLPTLFRAIAACGGLLPFAKDIEAKKFTQSRPSASQSHGRTCIEKIVARNALFDDSVASDNPVIDGDFRFSLSPGDQILCRATFRGVHEYTGGMVASLYAEAFGDVAVHQPQMAAAFEDHFVLLDHDSVPLTIKDKRLSPAQNLRDEMLKACANMGIKIHGPGRDLEAGVCHRLVVEKYARPGDIVVLTDSHTPTAGVLNCFAFGVGSTAMAFALKTGLIPVTVPKTVRVWLEGSADEAVSPKDLILHLIGDDYFRSEGWRTAPTDTCVIQFAGPGLAGWAVDELSVLTNMTVEGGLMTGIVEPCKPVIDFVTRRYGDIGDAWVYPDEDAQYEKTISLNLRDVPITVATPGDSRNRAPLDSLGEIVIHNVVVASCTGASLSDLKTAAGVLKDRKLAKGVRLTLTPSSQAVADDAEAEGLFEVFRAAGAEITPPGCGACIGNGPGIPRENEVTVSTTNRNFDRRMGAPGPVYLVSPAVAAASAVTGKLTDPRALPQL